MVGQSGAIKRKLGKRTSSKKTAHKLTHKFQWPVPLELTVENVQSVGLVKGVAMTEGKLKSGELMTAENVIAGAGAMRASAILEAAVIDIDHHKDKLPAEYTKKYGKEINDPYPVGFIIDAQAVKNKVQPSNEEKYQVEYLAIIENPHVYQMIREGKFKGNSVVDFVRDLSCTHCDSGDCPCQYEGSAYIMNTLILDEVANSNSTWVNAVDESDIGTILEAAKTEEAQKHSVTPLGLKLSKIAKHIKPVQHSELGEYMEDGTWNDGKSSITSFLVNEKAIDETAAAAMAEYLFSNPTSLSQYQFEWMSTEDLTAWWNSIQQMEQIHSALKNVKHRIATLEWLEHNAKVLSEIKQSVPFGQGEVEYGEKGAGAQCQECRWSSFWADDESEGHCMIVAGDISRTSGCNQFEAIPGSSGATEEPEGEEPPADDPGTEAPADEEGQQEDEVEPDEEGNCPEGYTLSEDGTMCVKTEAVAEEGEQPDKVPAMHSLHKRKYHGKGLVEEHPEQATAKKVQELDREIQKLRVQAHDLGKGNFANREGMKRLAQKQKIEAEIERLEQLKKK